MIEDLYTGLYNDGNFTGTLEDFQINMQDVNYRKMLHSGIVEDGDFTGDFNAFEEAYAPTIISSDPARKNNKVGIINIEKDNETWLTNVPYLNTKKPEEIIENLFHIDNTTNGLDGFVRERAATKYFDLSSFDASRQKIIKGNRYLGYKRSEEDDLKSFFGEQKYNEYITYQQTGELPFNNIDFKSILKSELSIRVKEKQEEYLAGLETEDRSRALIMMPDIFGNFPNLSTEASRKADEIEYRELYPLSGPLLVPTTKKGRDGKLKTFYPPQSKESEFVKGSPQAYTENLKQQENYLVFQSKDFETKLKKYQDDMSLFQEENKDSIDKLNRLESQIKDLGSITTDSSAEEIQQYNYLVKEFNAIQKILKNKGYNDELQKLLNTREELTKKFDYLQNVSAKFEDIAMASKTLGLNYSILDKAVHNLEKAFLGDIPTLPLYFAKLGADAVEYLLPGEQQDVEILNAIQNGFQSHISYNESLQARGYEQFRAPLKSDLVTTQNTIRYGLDQLAQASPTILTILGGQVVGGIAKRALGATASNFARTQTMKKVANQTMRVFFGMESGGFITDMEIKQRNAAEMITLLEEKYSQATTAGEKSNIMQQISDQQTALDTNEWQKAFSSIAYGTIAAYAERLGTLNYIYGLNGFATAVGSNVFKKFAYGAGNVLFNLKTEAFEEIATLIGQNMIDVTVLGEDKSLFEGIDKDFLNNIFITSLAIQGPNMGMNSYNIIKDEFKSIKDINKNRQLYQELINIQEMLENPLDYDINSDMRYSLVQRKRDILKEAALSDVMTVQKAARMAKNNKEDLFEVFELNRKNRKIRKELRDLGAVGEDSRYVRNTKEKLQKQLQENEAKRTEYFNKPEQRRRKKLADFYKEKGIDLDGITGEAEFYLGRKEFNEDIIRGLGANVVNFQGENARQEFEAYLKRKLDSKQITQEDYNKALSGFDRKSYAQNIGDDVILFEDNIMQGISVGGFNAMMASASPLHELLHIQNKKAGIVNDKGVVQAAVVAVQEIKTRIEELYERGKIKKSDYKLIQRRIKKYGDMKNGANLEELINLAGDLKVSGIMGRETFSLTFAFKSLLNKVAKKVNKENSLFFMFNDVDDVLRYIDSFHSQAKKGDLSFVDKDEDKINSIKESIGVDTFNQINDLIPEDVKTRDQFLEFFVDQQRNVELGKALAPDGIIYNTVRKNTTSGEFETAIDEVRDRVINFNPEATRSDGTLVGREGFTESIFANLRFAKMVARKELASKKPTETIDTKEARELVADATDLDNTLAQDSDNITKINVLQIGKIASKQNDIIKSTKVKQGDTFREVIDNNSGNVGNIIFDIPANKISNPQDNITTEDTFVDNEGKELTKAQLKAGQKGIPVGSEAKKIQDFFKPINTAKSFIRILPETNVSEKDADVNKLGENIDVQREVYGRAIGMPNLILEYFYNKKFNENGKRARSQGKTSQVALWELKPEFKNLTDQQLTKAAEQFQSDLGIGEQSIPRSGKVKSGQFVKGAAVVMSQQASLSAAQRVLEGDKAPKAQVASVTAAQSKVAFSESTLDFLGDLFANSKTDPNFNLDLAGRIKLDTLLVNSKLNKTLNLSKEVLTPAGRKKIVDNFKSIMRHGPKEMWFGKNGKGASVFTKNNADYGISTMTETNPNYDKAKSDAFNQLKKDLLVVRDDKNYNDYGAPIKDAKGKVITDFTVSGYNTLLGNPDKAKENTKKIKDFNNKVTAIHKALWTRFAKSIKDDRKLAPVIGTYLRLVSNDTAHWHKLGAAIVGYSTNPKGIGKRLYEYEHAMPATAAYLYLIKTALDKKADFNLAYKAVMQNYKLIALDRFENAKLGKNGLARSMPLNWRLDKNFWWERYFNELVDINPNSIVTLDGKTFAKAFDIPYVKLNENIKKGTITSKAIIKSKQTVKESRGMSTFDFDETLIDKGENFIVAKKGNETIKISSGRWPIDGPTYAEQGYSFDFTDFVNVRGGVEGPLLQKMRNQIKKFGPNNVFVLTARPPESATAIHEWLKTKGINIPFKNITGLGNSTGDAKAMWMLEKFSEGYNDMYFVDDALPNVKAVKNVLDQLDIKSKVVQAKVKFSEGLDSVFNDVLEDVTGIDSKKRYSQSKARKRGEGKGRFRLFIPPSHEDFLGLLYNFIGKGEKGNKHRDFFEKALIKPLNKGYQELTAAKQSIANDYKNLTKQMPSVKKMLNKKTPDGDYYYSDAIRVYLWNKSGFDIPGMSKTDVKDLVNLVQSDAKLRKFADTVGLISRIDEGYVEPGENWDVGDIRTDLADATGRVGRAGFFTEFQQNAEIIFSKENLNKIEAAYGRDFREALEDMLYRIKTGSNRRTGPNKIVNGFLDYLNGSIGSTMFFNARSAVLQTLSSVNFINFGDNNIFKASAAFANQPQFWSDFAMIFNSDVLKQRRAGGEYRLDANEIAALVAKSKTTTGKVRAAIKHLLNLGFLPTQIADSFAISLGGASFYRNRVNTYLKQGLSQKEAEAKAFTDFQDISEATQQSARPDRISQQQASVLGRLILAFQNTPSQYARLVKKAGLDLINRRKSPPYDSQVKSDMSNISRIIYYGAIQNVIFMGLQSALFAMLFGEEEEDDEKTKKFFDTRKQRVINGTIDTLLRGSGVAGAVVATVKNAVIKYGQQQEKGWGKKLGVISDELLQLSPPIGIKARKLDNFERTMEFNKKVIPEMDTFDINNPMWSAYAELVEGATNIPVARLHRKVENIRAALDNENAYWQRVALGLGWGKWELGIENKEVEAIKKELKKVRDPRGGGKRGGGKR
tara:strand:- start:117 stop:8438 length:8322 start_codon:yes stop_codon:yes gene_type:complete